MPPAPCTLAFRGHQDQCFGLKLLFQPDTFERLREQRPDVYKQLARGQGMYQDAPSWWRQVLEAASVPYTQVAPSLWRVTLGPQFLRRALPMFTLTTAVAGRRLRFDSYCALHVARKQLYVYENEILDSRRCGALPDFSGGGRRLARQATGMDPLHFEAEPISLSAGGSFRIRTGDLVGRLGYLTRAHPEPQWQSAPPGVRTSAMVSTCVVVVPSVHRWNSIPRSLSKASEPRFSVRPSTGIGIRCISRPVSADTEIVYISTCDVVSLNGVWSRWTSFLFASKCIPSILSGLYARESGSERSSLPLSALKATSLSRSDPSATRTAAQNVLEAVSKQAVGMFHVHNPSK